MYTRITRSGGRRYLQIVEGYRSPAGVRQRVVANLGRLDRLDGQKLAPLIHGLQRALGRVPVSAPVPPHDTALAFGDVYALAELWSRLGFGEAIKRALRSSRRSFDAEARVRARGSIPPIPPSSDLWRYDRPRKQGNSTLKLSIVLPAKNEAEGLRRTVPALKAAHPDAELIVVDDGSTDDTARIASELGAKVLSSPYSMGNGAAIKRGARAASGEILVFMDADGQHDPADVARLLAKLDEGYDMVVGARDRSGQANLQRSLANTFYNRLASHMTGHRIEDLTSGFRAVRAERFREFLHLLPNGFSYPTTSTMAFFRSAYPVAYVPISVAQRVGTTSHIRPLKDGIRFLLIIFKIATLYAPLKLFAPAAIAFFLGGAGYYAWTFVAQHRFTNMSMLLFSAAVIIFLIGLISEQITSLTYNRSAVLRHHQSDD